MRTREKRVEGVKRKKRREGELNEVQSRIRGIGGRESSDSEGWNQGGEEDGRA